MKRFHAFLLALALVVTLSSVAAAQNRKGDDRDRGRDQDRWGQRHDNGRHNGWYKNGKAGNYGNYGRGGYWGNGTYRYPNGGYYGGYYPNGGYGYPSGGYGYGAASQWGYRDGVQAGQRDRSTGHSYRPAQWEAYKDADHGMSSSGGYYNSNQYRQEYRQAFLDGYNQGYGAGGYWGR